MKNKLNIAILITMTAILMSACGEVEAEEKEFIFIEKGESDALFESYILYFESVEDKAYYYVNVSGWEYDNFEANEGDVFKFNFKPKKFLNNMKVEIFDEYRTLNTTSKSFSE